MSLLALARYFRRAEDAGDVPGALVLLQNDQPAYIEEIRKGCGRGALAELGMDAGALADPFRWTFRNETGRIYFDVAFNKYTQNLRTTPAWKVDAQDVPRRGAVLVDEAHNIFAAARPFRTQQYINQMHANPELKLVFFTGTPTKDSLLSLLQMLNTLRGDDKMRPEPGYYFSRLPDGTWRWNEGKREEFGQDVLGYVSYATLERERSIYPHFGAHVNIAEGVAISNAGGAEVTATPALGCGFTFGHTKDADNSLVLVRVPALAAAGGPNPFFKYMGLTEPPAWDACGCLLGLNADRKHFLYLWNDSGRSGLQGFKTRLETNHRVVFVDWNEFCRDLSDDLPQADAVRAFQDHFPNEGLRAVDITKPTKMSLFQRIYNSAENARGQLVRVVLGGGRNKEGLSLFSTHFVHVLQPPKEQGNFRQAIRRVARYCSMSQVEPGEAYANWVITVLVYCAPSQLAEARALRIDATEKTPADLAQIALQEAAIDCRALKPLNKLPSQRCDVDDVEPGGDAFVCIDLTDRSVVVGAAHQAACPHLWTTARYTLTDEILRQFLARTADPAEGDRGGSFFLAPTTSLQDTYAQLRGRTDAFKAGLRAYLEEKRHTAPAGDVHTLERLARGSAEALLAQNEMEKRIANELRGWDELLEATEVDDEERRLNEMWQGIRTLASELHR